MKFKFHLLIQVSTRNFLQQILDKVKFGKDDDRTPFQRFINGSFWLISVSRNAIIIIIGCIIAAVLAMQNGEIPFGITGTLEKKNTWTC